MTAHDAVVAREDIKRLRGELNKIVQYLNAESDMRKALSAAAGVLDVTARLEFASRMLDDYDTVLSKALYNTQIKEVILP